MDKEDRLSKKAASPLYLGLDFSTQQLKAVCIDNQLKVTHEFNVVFDEEEALKEYKTEGGVCKNEEDLSVTAPTLMWVKALDLLLERMQSRGFPFCRLVGVSGSGQQHGSVYWRKGSEHVLENLSPDKNLAPQLQGCFSVRDSPVWMDSSTTLQCRQLEEAVGGAQQLANHTGSRAYERFTGNQIAKIHQQVSQSSAYKEYPQTERISLVSSFGASLLLGKYAAIDYSDGSGMNLMDIDSKKWWQPAAEACGGPELQEKLGPLVPTKTVLGPISRYYVERYGVCGDCIVSAFMGDNPASLAGMRLQQGDVVVSLGTSDTLFLWIDRARPRLMGHVFVNPVDESAYMALLCYKNGSKTREIIRDKCADGKWEEFDRLLDLTEPGNHGNIGIYFADPEITPAGRGLYRFDEAGNSVEAFPPEVEVRALVEGQLMAKLFHAQQLGYEITPSSRVLVTGGASNNKHIRQIVADIFNADIYILEETANSASLGAAYCAKRAASSSGTFQEAVEGAPAYKLACSPRPGSRETYQPLIARYGELEKKVTTQE